MTTKVLAAGFVLRVEQHLLANAQPWLQLGQNGDLRQVALTHPGGCHGLVWRDRVLGPGSKP